MPSRRARATVVVQIPCYNESATLPLVLASIPRWWPGGARVRILVIDDGSTDGTSEVARRAGADVVVRHARNRGLAAAFKTGLAAALRLGADVIVNTDGDNQYPQADIPRLVAPILSGEADVVVADRQPARVAHFSPLKKRLQHLGSAAVRRASSTDVHDAPSGFRAYSREAARRLFVHSAYSYTLETLVQAGAQRLKVVSVPVVVNAPLRPSRLMSSLPAYLLHSGVTMLRAFTTYRPLAVFTAIGGLFLAIGSAGIVRFLYYYFTDGGAGHVQSVVLAAMLFSVGVMIVMSGLLADLAGANRRLVEEALYELRRAAPAGTSRPRAAPRGARRARRSGAVLPRAARLGVPRPGHSRRAAATSPANGHGSRGREDTTPALAPAARGRP